MNGALDSRKREDLGEKVVFSIFGIIVQRCRCEMFICKYVYIYIYICVCVCVLAHLKEANTDRSPPLKRTRDVGLQLGQEAVVLAELGVRR